MTADDQKAPLDIEALPDFWDARRARLGKPDKSTCAVELRLALKHALEETRRRDWPHG